MNYSQFQKHIPFILALSLSFIIVCLPFIASAQIVGKIITCQGVDCNNWTAIVQTANNLVDFLFRLAVMLATVSIAFAGFLYLTANGDTGQIKRAHGIFLKVLIGFIIMLSAWVVVKLVLRLAGPDYNLLQ